MTTINPDTDVIAKTKPGEYFWLEIENVALSIKHEDEGIVIDAYPNGDEMSECRGTAVFYFEDFDPEEEEDG